MNKNSNTYIIAYSTLLVVVVAAVLSYASISLQPFQQANIRVEKMSAILSSIGQGKDVETSPLGKDKYIEEQYSKYIISSFCVNAEGDKVEGLDEAAVFKTLDNLKEVFVTKTEMPVFEARLDDGMNIYVLPVYGAGLWGPVWGYIALKDDCNTVYGATFDHKGETPGLGAEIALPSFSNQFVGKQIFEGDEFKSIRLSKGVGSSSGDYYAVDAISGGTLTSNGVSAMLKNCLGDYVPFLDKVRKASAVPDNDMSLGALADSSNMVATDTVVLPQ